ncbi:MAG: hypothetical protein MZW92_19970 [Comamonadaceae bacterium]|nr:hypothetical protein [Comamonadaceae bacterium]
MSRLQFLALCCAALALAGCGSKSEEKKAAAPPPTLITTTRGQAHRPGSDRGHPGHAGGGDRPDRRAPKSPAGSCACWCGPATRSSRASCWRRWTTSIWASRPAPTPPTCGGWRPCSRSRSKLVERQRNLVDRGFISQNAVDDAVAQRDALREQLAAARARGDATRSSVGKTRVAAPVDGGDRDADRRRRATTSRSAIRCSASCPTGVCAPICPIRSRRRCA